MSLSPDLLLTFHAVAEFGNVSHAARHLHLGQPAVSSQLKQLQQHFDTPLYHRHARGIALTPTGLEVLQYARSVHLTMQEFEQYLNLKKQGQARPVRLGVAWMLSATIASLLKAAREQGHHIEVHSGNSMQLVQKVKEGILDAALGVGVGPVTLSGLQARVFDSQPLKVLCSPDHPLAEKQGCTWQDLQDQTLLWAMQDSVVRRAAQGVLIQLGVHTITQEVGGVLGVREGLLQNLGVAIAPVSLFHLEVAGGHVLDKILQRPEVVLDVLVVSPPVELLDRAVRDVLALLGEC